MDTTTNYGLSKPGYGDSPDIEVLGQNADVIDTELKKAQDHRENSDVHMSTEEKGTLNSAVQSATFGGTAVPQDGAKLEIPMPNAGQVGASNPNLLINGDFQVWQRGTVSFNTDRAYLADRWILDLVSASMAVSKTAYGIFMHCDSNSSSYPGIQQNLETINPNLIGKTVTFSALIYSTADCRIIIQKRVQDGTYTTLAGSSVAVHPNYDVVSCTADLTGLELTDSLAVKIQFHASTGDIDVFWTKLELGSVATPFSPRPYAEELALCQRYSLPVSLLNVGSTIITQNTIEFFVPTPVTMRIAPDILNEPRVLSSLDGVIQVGFIFAYFVLPNGIKVIATKANHELTGATLNFDNDSHQPEIFDAEIY